MIADRLVGAVGRRHAHVDHLGTITGDAGWRLDWWIGADDRWRLPLRETTVRQRLVGDVPVVETAMRVASGDALHRAYGVGGPGNLVVTEVENASPVPFVVAFVVRGARQIALDGATVVVDGEPALLTTRAPSRWATNVGAKVEIVVTSGGAETGEFVARRDRAGRIDAAFLHPVAHRTTLRAALALERVAPDTVDVAGLPSGLDAARGWDAQLGRGMQVELPDESLAAAIRAARAHVLLQASSRRPSSTMVAALEDWGFDPEAAEGWRLLSGRERRRAAQRAPAGSWSDIDHGGDPSELLVAVRALLVHERDDDLTLLAELPAHWRGQQLDVHDAPTRLGPVSYAVRWHGARPALLWQAPPGVTLRAPALDAGWTTTESSGEALFAA